MTSSVKTDNPPNTKSGSTSHSRRSTAGLTSTRQDLICNIKYTNKLPDIPFDPKFLVYPFEPNRFVQYHTTSLERNHKHELLTEIDLGIPINLIDPSVYDKDPNDPGIMHPVDQLLLEDEATTPTESKRAKQHAKNISWLRKTEYISSEYARTSQMGGDSSENKIGIGGNRSRQKQALPTDGYKDKDLQIKAIEETFEASRQKIKHHYSKPGVKALNELPLYPDIENWQLLCAHIIFDSDPSPANKTESESIKEMSNAIMHGTTDEKTNEEYVDYFLPTEETLEKRENDMDTSINYTPDYDYMYNFTREYNWTPQVRSCEESYFFIVGKDGAFYNELTSKIKLTKRRTKGKLKTVNLAVKHRELTEEELNRQEARLEELDTAAEFDQEEELSALVHADMGEEELKGIGVREEDLEGKGSPLGGAQQQEVSLDTADTPTPEFKLSDYDDDDSNINMNNKMNENNIIDNDVNDDDDDNDDDADADDL